jgi:hypothetical protein
MPDFLDTFELKAFLDNKKFINPDKTLAITVEIKIAILEFSFTKTTYTDKVKTTKSTIIATAEAPVYNINCLIFFSFILTMLVKLTSPFLL